MKRCVSSLNIAVNFVKDGTCSRQDQFIDVSNIYWIFYCFRFDTFFVSKYIVIVHLYDTVICVIFIHQADKGTKYHFLHREK